HRNGRAAAGVAIELGEDDARDVERFVEGLGDVHGVLAGHGVHGQQNFVGLDRGLDVDELLHHGFVDVQPPGGVDDDHVVAVALGQGNGLLGGLYGVFGAALKHRQAELFAHHLQLFDGGGAVDVAGGE